MSKKKIFIILPYKESLDPNFAGAVSIYVKDTTNYSKYKKDIKIISSENFNKIKIFRNKNYIKNFCKKYENIKIDVIEIHNRPEYLSYIKKYFPNTKINLFFHNDPLTLRGSENIEEREYILSNTNKIIFLSNWIQQMFFFGLKNVNLNNVVSLPVGIDKEKIIHLHKKEKKILFVGKLNKAKGYHIFCKAASKFKKYDPSWNFIAIGNETRKEIFPSKNSVTEIGYLKNREVLDFYKKSEIAIGNSVWNEPLGRIAIEASSRKCLPIITDKGGLAESKKIAHVLKKNTANELFKYLVKITKNDKLRKEKQNLFYKNNNFDLKKLSNELDKIRDNFLKKSIILRSNGQKILHVANFNENSDGRLFYSFANKLNSGFIKNNHIVETISDRSYIKLNRSILNPFSDIKKFNNKILNTLKNFSPNMLLIGHVFNIKKDVFEYCNKNDIKICSWYIDSVSKEFLNKDKKQKFLSNLKFIDKCFITSSPKIFKKNKYFKKIRFIPNPVDSSIDYLKNFNNTDFNFDIFSAISHGQNRGVLKKGKFDEREKFIKEIIYNLPQLKFASFGMDNFEPIWGANYYNYLSKSKMAINISRGSYQNLYSSDRISSLIGNGLLVFINKKAQFQKLFTNNEVVFFNNKKDLISKINYFSANDKSRVKFSKQAYNKYHKHMNNRVISDYILNSVDLINSKKPFWHNKI
ncbi:glycosyltransferase [Pelagibacterales bacterium SAG-MED06]|nr:glycosyltransferase [Pelagibacterales bacterium SAG-MED06]